MSTILRRIYQELSLVQLQSDGHPSSQEKVSYWPAGLASLNTTQPLHQSQTGVKLIWWRHHWSKTEEIWRRNCARFVTFWEERIFCSFHSRFYHHGKGKLAQFLKVMINIGAIKKTIAKHPTKESCICKSNNNTRYNNHPRSCCLLLLNDNCRYWLRRMLNSRYIIGVKGVPFFALCY